jgi:uncharacterized SAM-binding protein YcdF (DUF218 family)
MASRNQIVRRWAAVGIILLVVFCCLFAFLDAGRWLIREDPPGHADAILVLSGSMPYRAEEAAKIYRQGYAPEVWLTHPESTAEELQAMDIHFISDEQYDTEVLTHGGVPAAAIHVLPGEIVDTQQEIAEAYAELRREGKSTVLIVTSPEHTHRVRTLWEKLVGSNARAIIRGAPEDPFDAGHWWRSTRDALKVTREYMGLLNAWTGLRVRPLKR